MALLLAGNDHLCFYNDAVSTLIALYVLLMNTCGTHEAVRQGSNEFCIVGTGHNGQSLSFCHAVAKEGCAVLYAHALRGQFAGARAGWVAVLIGRHRIVVQSFLVQAILCSGHVGGVAVHILGFAEGNDFLIVCQSGENVVHLSQLLQGKAGNHRADLHAGGCNGRLLIAAAYQSSGNRSGAEQRSQNQSEFLFHW